MSVQCTQTKDVVSTVPLCPRVHVAMFLRAPSVAWVAQLTLGMPCMHAHKPYAHDACHGLKHLVYNYERLLTTSVLCMQVLDPNATNRLSNWSSHSVHW